jgi:hypothetical protein
MATIQWIGMSGDWSNSFDWSTGAVPGPLDDAIIAAAGIFAVSVTTLDTAAALLSNSGATLDVQSGGTLALTGSLTVLSGTLRLDGGTVEVSSIVLDGRGVIDNTGNTIDASAENLVLAGGTLVGGDLIAGPGGIINAPSGVTHQPHPTTLQDVTVLGGLTLNGGALQLAGGGRQSRTLMEQDPVQSR